MGRVARLNGDRADRRLTAARVAPAEQRALGSCEWYEQAVVARAE
jgi:hypothetical protein